MRLHNITRAALITENLKVAQKWWDKTLGLLSKKNPRSLLFYTRFGIHTFGLKLPIDVLVLDNSNKVVILKQNLHPNRFFFWNPRYNQVIELPSGLIKQSHTKIGDRLKIS